LDELAVTIASSESWPVTVPPAAVTARAASASPARSFTTTT
jgi:hypothetical protein